MYFIDIMFTSYSMDDPPIKGYFCKIPNMKPCNFKIEINNNNYIYIYRENGWNWFYSCGSFDTYYNINKVQILRQKNGDLSCACGFLDKPLVDDDEVEIKYFELSENVKGIYMKPKGHHHEDTDSDTDDDDE